MKASEEDFLVSTTSHFDGMVIVKYLGVVFEETVMLASIWRRLSLKYTFGGELGKLAKPLKEARERTVGRLIEQAKSLGANAIVGLHVDYERVVDGFIVSAYGTAVVVEKS